MLHALGASQWPHGWINHQLPVSQLSSHTPTENWKTLIHLLTCMMHIWDIFRFFWLGVWEDSWPTVGWWPMRPLGQWDASKVKLLDIKFETRGGANTWIRLSFVFFDIIYYTLFNYFSPVCIATQKVMHFKSGKPLIQRRVKQLCDTLADPISLPIRTFNSVMVTTGPSENAG